MSDVPEDQVLSCGCLVRCSVENGERVMKLIACRPDCRIVALTLEEADAQGKPVEVRDT